MSRGIRKTGTLPMAGITGYLRYEPADIEDALWIPIGNMKTVCKAWAKQGHSVQRCLDITHKVQTTKGLRNCKMTPFIIDGGPVQFLSQQKQQTLGILFRNKMQEMLVEVMLLLGGNRVPRQMTKDILVAQAEALDKTLRKAKDDRCWIQECDMNTGTRAELKTQVIWQRGFGTFELKFRIWSSEVWTELRLTGYKNFEGLFEHRWYERRGKW